MYIFLSILRNINWKFLTAQFDKKGRYNYRYEIKENKMNMYEEKFLANCKIIEATCPRRVAAK